MTGIGPGAAAQNRPLAEAIGITKRYGPTVALRDAHLAVYPGESHALVGRNGAGKSTLVSIMTGQQQPDAGEVVFDGRPAPTPADTGGWRSLVACVYQHSTIIPELSVAENLYVNRQPTTRFGRISWRRLRAEAGALLEHWAVDVSPDARAGDLRVEQRQLVEIARALSFGARFIVLDEPTAQLDSAEIDRLFSRMRALQDSGVTFLFISHHLQEVYQVCQTVTVMRDARSITTAPVADLPRGDLVDAMTGEAGALGSVREPSSRPAVTGDRLTVRGLAGEGFADLDLTVGVGEVVGFAGSSSSGKIAIAESLVGLRRATAGRVMVDGDPVPLGDVPGALAAGVGCVPRDRHGQGLVLDMTVGENATMTVADRLGPLGLVLPDRLHDRATKAIADLAIVTAGPGQRVAALSGGNQQKVVMARALATTPRLLVLINPTAGVDVKSKEALLDIVGAVSAAGTAVIVVSDELDDLRACDRVLVFLHGRLAARHPAGWRDGDLVASIEGV